MESNEFFFGVHGSPGKNQTNKPKTNNTQKQTNNKNVGGFFGLRFLTGTNENNENHTNTHLEQTLEAISRKEKRTREELKDMTEKFQDVIQFIKSSDVLRASLAPKDDTFSQTDEIGSSDIICQTELTVEEIDKIVKEKKTLQDQLDSNTKESQQLNQELIRIKMKLKESSQEIESSSKIKYELLTINEEQIKLIKAKEEGMDECFKKMSQLNNKISELENRYLHELGERKKLHNLVQDLKGNIRVICRVRPLTEKEQIINATNNFKIEFPLEDSLYLKDRNYEFDRVFDPSSTQEEVYTEISPLIKSAIDGYFVNIFTYGQTGSGKTFTMEGTNQNPGVIFRSFSDLFLLARNMEDQGYSRFKMTLNVVEIYNEMIRDLTTTKQEFVDVSQSANGSVCYSNLNSIEIFSVTQALDILNLATKNRTIFSTDMNEHSSRSHLLVCVNITGENLTNQTVIQGKLQLVDLAGSERVSKSLVTGERLKEAQHINKSLSSLGNVFSALLAKSSHIPIRDSKLTFYLKDFFLGKNSKNLMIVQLNGFCENENETLCSLQFACRVKNIELGASSKNVDFFGMKLKKTEEDLKKNESTIKNLTEKNKQLEEKNKQLEEKNKIIEEKASKFENLSNQFTNQMIQQGQLIQNLRKELKEQMNKEKELNKNFQNKEKELKEQMNKEDLLAIINLEDSNKNDVTSSFISSSKKSKKTVQFTTRPTDDTKFMENVLTNALNSKQEEDEKKEKKEISSPKRKLEEVELNENNKNSSNFLAPKNNFSFSSLLSVSPFTSKSMLKTPQRVPVKGSTNSTIKNKQISSNSSYLSSPNKTLNSSTNVSQSNSTVKSKSHTGKNPISLLKVPSTISLSKTPARRVLKSNNSNSTHNLTNTSSTQKRFKH